MSRTLEFIPIAKVVANGDNPRTSTDDASIAELVESIKRHGVLMPVLVDEPVKGKYHLQAGARRLAAAKQAGLKEIPAQIGKVNDGTLTAALTENVLREDLTPLEEAAALKALQEQSGVSARELAKRLGKSNDWVSDRLRLVKLPEEVRAAVEDGTIGLHAVPAIARLAEVAPRTSAAVVAQLNGDHGYTSRDLEDPEMFVEMLGEALEAPDGELWTLNGIAIKDLPVEDAGELAARHVRAKTALGAYNPSGYISFDEDDVDAARAFGCLFTVEDTNWQGRKRQYDYVNDAAWLADRIRLKIEYAEAEAEKKGKELDAETAGARPSKDVAAGDADAIAKAKEERRKEREKAEKARATARGHNLDLGVKLAKTFKAPKLTADNVRLVAELALEGRLDAAYRGLRYVDERLQTVEAQKNGKQKITYADSGAAAKLLRAELDKAKTPEEILGVVLRAITAAHYASQDVVAQSSRSYWHVPGTGYGGNRVGKLIEKVAGKLVPPALKKGRR